MFGRPCDRKPSVVRNGKHYCWQHDPERISRLRKEAWEKHKKEMADREARMDAQDRRRDLEEKAGVRKLTDETLNKIVALGGLARMIEMLEADESI